ncbi:MAG: AMP-binding protein [Ilumatobacteraceae bacterium]
MRGGQFRGGAGPRHRGRQRADAARVAANLADRGARPGDRVAVIASADSPEYLAVALGALRSGVIPVLLNASLTPTEQNALLADAQPSFVLRDDDLARVTGAGRPAELARGRWLVR